MYANSVAVGEKVYINNYINIKYISMATVIGVLNSFYYDNFTVMFILCCIEVVWLFWCLRRKERITYICYYLIFLSFSMESEVFVGTSTFYGFKNFRIAGLNIAVWMLLPLIIVTIPNYKNCLSKIRGLHRSLLKKLTLFTLLGMIMGLLTYLGNDNGFGVSLGSFSQLVNSYYTYLIPYIEIIVFSCVICSHRELLPKLKQFLFSIIIALAIVFLVCLGLQNYGNRGGQSSLQVSDVYFLLVCSFVLLVYEEFDTKSKMVLGVSSVIILILSLLYNASGKIIIMTVLTPILMLIVMKRKGSATKTILFTGVAIILVIFVVQYLLPILMKNNVLLSTKYQQVRLLFSFGSDNWFDNIPSSPKMRIAEFLNIGYEFIAKPWFLPFGKGFGGTVKDRLGLFSDLSEFSFSEWELNLGAYFSMHESINCFFLVGGIFGLYVILSISLALYKKVHRSPWLLFGLAWILLFYNYHLTIAVYGIIALIVGLEDVYFRIT